MLKVTAKINETAAPARCSPDRLAEIKAAAIRLGDAVAAVRAIVVPVWKNVGTLAALLETKSTDGNRADPAFAFVLSGNILQSTRHMVPEELAPLLNILIPRRRPPWNQNGDPSAESLLPLPHISARLLTHFMCPLCTAPQFRM